MTKKIMLVICVVLAAMCVFSACSNAPADEPAKEQAPAAEAPAAEDEPAEEEPAAEEAAKPQTGVGAVFTPAEIKEAKDLKFVFDCCDLSNVIWSDLASSFESFCQEKGVQYTMMDSANDAAKQVANIESYIQSGYDAIAVAAVNVDAVNEICGKAQEAGIFTYAVGYLFDNAHCRLTQDDYENGYMIGEEAGKWLNENKADKDPAKVCILSQRNSDITILREQGIMDGLEAACTINYEVVSTVDVVGKQDGVDAGENVIIANPDLDAVVAIDSSAVSGFCQSLEAANVPFDQVGAFGVNGEEESMILMYEGKYVVSTITLGFNTEKGGIVANTMYNALMGEGHLETDWCQNTVINRENVAEMYARTYPGKDIKDAVA